MMEEELPRPEPPAPVPPLLPFDDPWQIRTRPCTFEGAVTAGEVVSLNHIRDMSGQRNLMLVREGNKFSCSPGMIDGFKKYLSNLAYLIDQEGERFDMSFEWSSPLSNRGSRFFRLNGLKKEQGLATFLYGSLLRQLAHQSIQDLLGLNPGSTAVQPSSDAAAAAIAGAVGQLRQAAGVFGHLAEVMLPLLFASMNGDRPAEILARCNTALSHLTLAEAQALTAFRAQHKGTSAAVVAALHAGAAELYEKAAKSIRDYIGDHVIASDRFRRYIAIGSGLSTARAYKALAGDLHAQFQAGAAERALIDALQLLSTSLNAADGDTAWRAILQQEVADVERLKKPIESDRLIVYMQPLPQEPPPLPAARVLVTIIPYAIERITNTTAEIAMHS